ERGGDLAVPGQRRHRGGGLRRRAGDSSGADLGLSVAGTGRNEGTRPLPGRKPLGPKPAGPRRLGLGEDPPVIRILLGDDHAIVRVGLKQVLADAIPGAVFEEASTALEALARIRASNFQIVVLDLSLPEGNGLDALKEIKRVRPALPVLILSVYSE